MRKNFKKSRGFTLIELMVVILILAILAALIVPRVIGRTSQAKTAKAQADEAQLRSFIQQFRLDTGRFPTSDEGLQALEVQPSDVTGWKGPYSDKGIPADPWNNEYILEIPGPEGEDSFSIVTYGADGAPGGTGENADIRDGVVEVQ
jgi:general secretion pathway protein G